jgi:hypothetical protein
LLFVLCLNNVFAEEHYLIEMKGKFIDKRKKGNNSSTMMAPPTFNRAVESTLFMTIDR